MSYQFRNITVLIVESSESMFSLTKNVLMTFGVNQIYSAYNAEEGFRTFCKLNPDLVITDWLEEPKNGLELTKTLRTHPESPNPFVPVILMTGYSQKRRVLMARDSGITEFLVKPFTARALYQRIEQLIEKPRLFVKSDGYFGPDRRRKRDVDYKGPERRSMAQPKPRQVTVSPSKTARDIQGRQEDKQ
ncbi:MAG: response regulator [Alphaproteobacteria bacterium]|nr:response regulator [Alphaproteobacteria bacterium]